MSPSWPPTLSLVLTVFSHHIHIIPGGGDLHSSVVICKQGHTDPTLNMDIFNMKLWPLFIDFHSKRQPFSLANYKYTPFSHTPLAHPVTEIDPKHWPFTHFSPFIWFCDTYHGPRVSAISVKTLPFSLFFCPQMTTCLVRVAPPSPA